MPTRLLIVEDHAIMREGLRRLLGAHPTLEIVGDAADSETGWAMAHTLQPELVIMDLDMPGEGGIALTFRIKTHYPQIKVVVMTGYLDPKFANDALKAGASGYLLKTNGAAELVTAIETVQGGKVYLCSATTTALVRGSQLSDVQKLPTPKIELPERERQVLQFVVQGLRNKEIAAQLELNVKTVETYRSRIMKRLNCSSPAELVRFAIREGLAEL